MGMQDVGFCSVYYKTISGGPTDEIQKLLKYEAELRKESVTATQDSLSFENTVKSFLQGNKLFLRHLGQIKKKSCNK